MMIKQEAAERKRLPSQLEAVIYPQQTSSFIKFGRTKLFLAKLEVAELLIMRIIYSS